MKIDVWYTILRKETLEVDDCFKPLLKQEDDDLLDGLHQDINQMLENGKADNDDIEDICGIFEAGTDNCIFEQ